VTEAREEGGEDEPCVIHDRSREAEGVLTAGSERHHRPHWKNFLDAFRSFDARGRRKKK
jgi:hypothetical protein